MKSLRKKLPSNDGDPLIPILNLVCMLIPLLLYGAVFVRFTTLSVKPPKIDRTEDSNEPRGDLNLTVFATDQGFHIKVNPQHRMAWMAQADGAMIGPDIPRKDGGWDFDALASRLEEIKGDHQKETRVILGATDDLAFDVLIKMMDVCRGSVESPLFPDVSLTRGVV